MLKQTFNKGISTPIAIAIVLILAVIVGIYTWWQYSELTDIKIKIIDTLKKEITCNEKCKSLGYLSGNCKSWTALPNTKVGCSADEITVGGASDCRVEGIVGGEKQCCCKTEVANFKDCLTRGYPVLESYPRQCETPDGRIFAEAKDETADWKTYKNEEYGFEVKYPNSWKVMREKEKGNLFLKKTPDNKIAALLFLTYGDTHSIIVESVSREDITLDEYFQLVQKISDRGHGTCENENEITVGGEKAIQCNWKKDIMNHEILKGISLYLHFSKDYSKDPEYEEIAKDVLNLEKVDCSYVVTIHQCPDKRIGFDLIYLVNSSLSGEEREDFYLVFDQILSTFKFLD